jgi:hypothetical protein
METDQWGCNESTNVSVYIELDTVPGDGSHVVQQLFDGVTVGNDAQHIVSLLPQDYPMLWAAGPRDVKVWATYAGYMSADCIPTVAVTIARQYADPS